MNELPPQFSLAEQTVTYGIILFTHNYAACCTFYGETLGLPVWYKKDTLTCFKFGGGYLMIETDGPHSTGAEKSTIQNPTILRFNVPDVTVAARALASKGVHVEIMKYDWGTSGSFKDPDGNWCGLKNADDPFFDL